MPTYEVDYWIRFYNGTITIEAESERDVLAKMDLKILDLSTTDHPLIDNCIDVEWDIDDIREA